MRRIVLDQLAFTDDIRVEQLLAAESGAFRDTEIGRMGCDSSRIATRGLYERVHQIVETHGYTPWAVTTKKHLFKRNEETRKPHTEHGLVVNRRVVFQQEPHQYGAIDRDLSLLSMSFHFDRDLFPQTTSDTSPRGAVIMESVRDELTEDSPTPQSALLLRAGRVVDHDNKRYFAPTTTIVVPGADTMGKTAVEYIQGRVMNRQGTPFVNERDMGTLHKIIDRVVVHGDDSNFAPISPEGIIMPEADGQHILPYDERHGLHSHPAIDLNAQVRWEQPLSQTLAQLP